MPPAVSSIPLIEQWLEEHSQICRRLHVRLAPRACQAAASADPDRCAGCGGLHDQSGPVLKLVQETAPGLPLAASIPVSEDVGTFSAEEDFPEDQEEFALRPLDIPLGLKGELLSIFAEWDEELLPERKAKKSRRGGVAVFLGRCRRCGGYMLNAIEKQMGTRDEEVYRCVCCGWRTSPIYEFNRNEPQQRR